MTHGLFLLALCGAMLAGILPDPARYECKEDNGSWNVRLKESGRILNVEWELDRPVSPGERLRLPYRTNHPENGTLANASIRLHFSGNRTLTRSVTISPRWTCALIPLEITSPARLQKITLTVQISPRSPKAVFSADIRAPQVEKDPEYTPTAAIPANASAYPLMDWKPGKPGTVYTSIVTDTEHPEKTWKITTSKHWCIPPEPLPEGIYRFRVTDGTRTCTSGQWRIIPDAHRWKLPAYDFRKLAAKPHPRFTEYLHVRYPEKDVVRRQAASFLKRPMPAPPEIYTPGKDPAIKSWIVWYSKIAGDVTGGTGFRLQYYAAAITLLPDGAKYRAPAREALMTVVRDWDPEGCTHPQNSDLHASQLLLGMVLVYDVCYHDLTPEERTLAAAALRQRGDLFFRRIAPIGTRDGNHCWDNVQAVAAAAAALAEEPGMADRFDFAAHLFAYKFLPNRGFDGESEEGVHYWSFGFGLGVRYLDLAKYVAGLDLYSQPWVKVTDRFPVYCQPPQGHNISFADNRLINHSFIGPVNRPFVAKLAKETGDGAAAWYAGATDLDVPPVSPAEIPQSKHFRHIGVTAFNTFLPDARESVAVGFHSGRYFGNHQHADQNSFVINAYGDKLAVDGGYYDWWGSEHFLRYSVRAEAHNTILVNKLGQALHVRGADGHTAEFLDTPEFGYVAGDGSKAFLYGGALTKFRRQIFFLKPDYVIVYDQLAAPEPSTFEFLLHSHTKQPIHVKNSVFRFCRPLAGLSGAILLPEKAKITVNKAYTVLPDEGRTGRKETHPQPEWTLSAANPAPAETAEFLAVMRITRAGVKTKELAWERLKTETPDLVAVELGPYKVVFNRHPGKSIAFAGRSFSGPAAAFRLENGRIAAEAVVGETKSVSDALKGTPCFITLDGKAVPAKRYEKRFPDGRTITQITGIMDLARETRVTVQCPRRTFPLYFTFSSSGTYWPGEVRPGEAAAHASLKAGKILFSFVSAEPFTSIAVTSGDAGTVPCVLEPADFAPPADAVKFEAENSVDPYSSAPAVTTRKDASGGRISTQWSGDTVCAEWEFTVPQTGKYQLWIRAAHTAPQVREVRLDGRPVGVPECVSMPPTGGFGYTSKDWRWFRLPQTVELAAGKHVLYLRKIQNSGNLDCFAAALIR